MNEPCEDGNEYETHLVLIVHRILLEAMSTNDAIAAKIRKFHPFAVFLKKGKNMFSGNNGFSKNIF